MTRRNFIVGTAATLAVGGGITYFATRDGVQSVPGAFVANLAKQPDGSLRLHWEQGQPPYQVWKTSDGNSWFRLGNPTMATGKEILPTSAKGFFRVQQQVPLLMIERSNEVTNLTWVVPELEEVPEQPANPPLPYT